MSLPLNLARRPLRNERLPTLLLSITCALLGAFTVRHGVVAFELRSGGARDVAGQLVSLERETDELSRQAASLGDRAPVPQQLKEWKTVKQLVDLRAFSWTGLFAALEEVLPPTVRLASVAPAASEGGGEGTQLTLSAVGRTDDDAVALLKALMGDVPLPRSTAADDWRPRAGSDDQLHGAVRGSAGATRQPPGGVGRPRGAPAGDGGGPPTSGGRRGGGAGAGDAMTIERPLWRRWLLPVCLVLAVVNLIGFAAWTGPRGVRQNQAAARTEQARAELVRLRELTGRLRERAEAMRANAADRDSFYGRAGSEQTELVSRPRGGAGDGAFRRAAAGRSARQPRRPRWHAARARHLQPAALRLVRPVGPVPRRGRALTAVPRRGPHQPCPGEPGSAKLQVDVSTFMKSPSLAEGGGERAPWAVGRESAASPTSSWWPRPRSW